MILVTGGLGFIGSHVVLNLLKRGQEVVIIDNLANSNLDVLQRLEYVSQLYIPFVKIDLRNTPALIRVFEQYPIDYVIHTAGFKSVDESIMKPLEYYNDNLGCLMSLLRAMQRVGVKKMIHFSSLAIYGQSSLSLTEQTAINFSYQNPYIQSHQMMEQILADTASTDYDWQIVSLRLGNVAGADESGIIGETINAFPKNIIPIALQVAAAEREYIELYQEAKTIDRTVERSFVHVTDVCAAVFNVMAWQTQQQNHFEYFDIANQVSSIQNLLHIIEAVTKKTIQRTILKREQNTIDQIGSVSQKAKRILYWQPLRDLHKMIEDEWHFYQK